MQPIRFCVAVNCNRRLWDEYPLCPRCWRRLDAPARSAVLELVEAEVTTAAGETSLAAHVLAALVTELPVRHREAEHLEANQTWPTVRANVVDRLEHAGIDYASALEPWRDYVATIYWQIGGLNSVGRWSCIEIACAMTRARLGVNGYEPYLFAAAVDVDEQLAAERMESKQPCPPTNVRP